MRDAGHRTPDAGHRTSDGEKSKNNISTPQGGGHNDFGFLVDITPAVMCGSLLKFLCGEGLVKRKKL